MTSAPPKVSGLALVLLAATACAGGASSPPAVLSDGTAARPPPVVLEGVAGESILTRARVLQPDSIESGSQAARCIGSADANAGAVVERVGVSGATITLVRPGRRAVYGCDSSAFRTEGGLPWCGYAFGRLHAGRLRDPRLNVTCRSDDDDPLGFAWIQPDTAASYLAVRRRGYNEIYPIAGRVPVRVVTDDVDQGSASATFEVSEHAKDGRRLSAYEVEARVSG